MFVKSTMSGVFAINFGSSSKSGTDVLGLGSDALFRNNSTFTEFGDITQPEKFTELSVAIVFGVAARSCTLLITIVYNVPCSCGDVVSTTRVPSALNFADDTVSPAIE